MVPEGWKTEKLGNYIKLSSGDTKPENIEKEMSTMSPYPVFGGNNVMGFSSSYNSEGSVILIGRVGEYCGVTRYVDQRCWITDNALFTKDISPDLNAEFLVSKLKYLDLSRLRNKGGQPLVSQKPIYGLKLTVPPLPEQKKIAQILSTWDQAITATERLLENSQLRKKGLMQQLLTGKKRLPGFEGEWKKVELGEALKYQQPTPFLVKSTEYSDEFSTPVLTAGKSFLLGYTDENIGVFSEGLPVIIFDDFTTASRFVDFPFKVKSSAMKILTAKHGHSIRYIFEAMQMIRFAVGGHQRHWISIFSNMVIPCPSLEEQQAISEVIVVADQELSDLRSRLESLKQEKKALMQKLLTGKLRVLINGEAA